MFSSFCRTEAISDSSTYHFPSILRGLLHTDSPAESQTEGNYIDIEMDRYLKESLARNIHDYRRAKQLAKMQKNTA